MATVRLSPRYGCCGGGADIVVAEARRPDEPSIYTKIETGKVVLYVEPTLVDETLILDVEGFLGFRSLFVDGASPTRFKESK
ncbi:hypothetical protein DU490_06115 [Halomonas sp. DQ26W]|nr:hypothetical protein DU490_06115 [Halomonas sp. DQ26W]